MLNVCVLGPVKMSARKNTLEELWLSRMAMLCPTVSLFS
jgi:hypothetical protein